MNQDNDYDDDNDDDDDDEGDEGGANGDVNDLSMIIIFIILMYDLTMSSEDDNDNVATIVAQSLNQDLFNLINGKSRFRFNHFHPINDGFSLVLYDLVWNVGLHQLISIYNVVKFSCFNHFKFLNLQSNVQNKQFPI